MPQLSAYALAGYAALRRAGALRMPRALRAGLRRALPERLAVVFVARLAFFAIFAMSFLSLSLFLGGLSAQYESTQLREGKYWVRC